MRRRTLDILFSAGGVLLAGLLLAIGVVLTSNASFANNYVTTQLTQQQITFPTVDKMSAEEKQQACLVQYAGQQMTTGAQAECYANHYIALHLASMAGGKTYAQLGTDQFALQAKVAAAQKSNDPNLAAVQKQYSDLVASRDTVFKGETLRGLLLTSYGFSEFGVKAAQGALVAFLAAGLLFLLSIAGFVHALVTPKTEAFAVPEPAPAVKPEVVTA
ncbi:MAG: hypothetical protein E6F99_17655 [Actinobacteria bacterium]|nr:MAG: hypothetical protein E6F99_17655 [Actinomycetota bacterium]